MCNAASHESAVSFGKVKCTPVKNQLKDVKPYSVITSRRIPIPLLCKFEEELKRREGGKIIQDVMEPTEWVALIVPIVKPNGKIWICIDKRLELIRQCTKEDMTSTWRCPCNTPPRAGQSTKKMSNWQ